MSFLGGVWWFWLWSQSSVLTLKKQNTYFSPSRAESSCVSYSVLEMSVFYLTWWKSHLACDAKVIDFKNSTATSLQKSWPISSGRCRTLLFSSFMKGLYSNSGNQASTRGQKHRWAAVDSTRAMEGSSWMSLHRTKWYKVFTSACTGGSLSKLAMYPYRCGWTRLFCNDVVILKMVLPLNCSQQHLSVSLSKEVIAIQFFRLRFLLRSEQHKKSAIQSHFIHNWATHNKTSQMN